MTSSRKPAEPTKYALEFNTQARKEWDKLGKTIQLQLAKKLKERLENPRVEADKLRDMPNCYKIKLRSIGYRLVYEVIDSRLVVIVIAVGKRERSKVYGGAANRL
ncbi:type II toxin-antitoxin system mRNA interferase toxin, RelE/StbE family [Stutzerimonas nosocomialis]|uniref:Type II toxin-antitoxin system mRNA interferase toxin, RelE/StbE family n=1 Tax=Stutzerimonas nosocomialis TaxID=1056496 RepID=A0A5R9QEI2_9GAMM|nr:type II toxin-antitoxin system RelE/ParE family toxin [Stutzerimonas nosocomialis]TLX63534.1 type II toxin-antitoxin system mRNA interferase toxin, RelE/StbE family [Stutzerimonas nosocomialis]